MSHDGGDGDERSGFGECLPTTVALWWPGRRAVGGGEVVEQVLRVVIGAGFYRGVSALVLDLTCGVVRVAVGA